MYMCRGHIQTQAFIRNLCSSRTRVDLGCRPEFELWLQVVPVVMILGG